MRPSIDHVSLSTDINMMEFKLLIARIKKWQAELCEKKSGKCHITVSCCFVFFPLQQNQIRCLPETTSSEIHLRKDIKTYFNCFIYNVKYANSV